MRARFIGDPRNGGEGPDTITVFGHAFTKGEWREVSNGRFARHNHFETEGELEEEAPTAEPVADKPPAKPKAARKPVADKPPA